MYTCRELGYTLNDFLDSETVYNVGLWGALKRVEEDERVRRELAEEVSVKLEQAKRGY